MKIVRFLEKICLLFVVILVAYGCDSNNGNNSGDSDFIAGFNDIGSVYSNYFHIGGALEVSSFDSLDTYPDSLLAEFTSFTAENCMKPEQIQNYRGSFYWTKADKLADFARGHDLTMRGHVLVWHSQSPSWMAPENDKATARSNMEDHINAVVGRYQDIVSSWDVVNEAILDSGGDRTGSMWYLAYGDNTYIQDAFSFTRAALDAAGNTAAQLYYNDYNVVNSSKRADILDMIDDLDLTSHGLDGIGAQAHWRLDWPSVEDIQTMIDDVADAGLDLQITELDIDCYNGDATADEMVYSLVEAALADRYEEIFQCFRKNSDTISSVTFWGIADDHSWMNNYCGGQSISFRQNYAMPFTTDHQAKEAYYRVTDTTSGEW